MSDTEPPEQPQGPPYVDEEYHSPAIPVGGTAITYPADTVRGGRSRKGPRAPRPPKPQDHWAELQELRGKLAEHEETMAKLKSAFGMISVALDIRRPETGMSVDSGAAVFGDETPAHRPPRLSRRGGANCINSSHYKNNNRGGGYHNNNNGGGNAGGFRSHRGNAPGFRGP